MKTKFFKKISLLIFSSILLFAAGCKGSGSNYEGANLKFNLPSANWEVTYRVVNDENTLLELTNSKYIVDLSLMACETTEDCAEEIFETIRVGDAAIGKISEAKTENNVGAEGGTAYYQYKVDTSYGSQYWSVFAVKNAGDGKFILANSNIYVSDPDKGEAQKCKAEVEKLIKSLEYSEVTDTGSIEKALNESTMESNVIGNYIKGGVSDYSLPTKDADVKLAEGCSYVYQMALYDYSGEEFATVYAPLRSESDTDGFGSFYFDYGVDFSIMPVGMIEYETPEECIKRWVEETAMRWKDYSTEYQNGVVDNLVMADGDNAYVQHLQVERVNYDSTTYDEHSIIYYGKDEAGFAYYWTISITLNYFAGEETNAILAELSQFYDIDLTQYGLATETQTKSGKRMEEGQDIYTPSVGDADITKADGYTYMGTTEIKTYDETPYSVMIPMCKELSFSDSFVSARLHGVDVFVSLNTSYTNKEISTVVKNDAEREYNYLLEQSRDYKELELGDLKLVEGADGAYQGFKCEKVLYGSDKFYPYYQVRYALNLENNDYVAVTIKMDTADFDMNTNTVLKDIEKAYHMDLSEYYYNP